MKLVFATNNAHKLEEIKEMLGSRHEIVSLKDGRRSDSGCGREYYRDYNAGRTRYGFERR